MKREEGIFMKKIKRFVAIFLSFGLMLAGTLTASAAEQSEQWPEESVSSETITVQELSVNRCSDPLFVKGNGVRLRRTPGTSGDVVGLLYENKGDWVRISGVIEQKDGYWWQEVVESSIGLQGWIATNYIF